MMTVSEAERTVAAARMADLVAAQTAAWRRHRAAKGLVTRALKDGSAERIAAAQERERQAWAEADEIADAGIRGMFVINQVPGWAGFPRSTGRSAPHGLPTLRSLTRSRAGTRRPGSERGEADPAFPGPRLAAASGRGQRCQAHPVGQPVRAGQDDRSRRPVAPVP